MKEENVIIRFAKEEELERVNEIRKQVHTLHCDGRADIFKTGGWDDIKDVVNERFASEESGVIVACMGEKIVGAAVVQFVHKPESAFQQARDFYHVEEFGVDEEYRRRGIATLLIDFMKKDAMERGFKKIELDMWEFNETALRFYESVGFMTYRRALELGLRPNGV